MGDWGGSWLSSEPGPPPPGGLISLALPGSPVRSGSCSQPASPCLFAASRAHPKTSRIWPEHLKGWPEAVALPETHTINVSFTCWGSAPGARRRRLSGRSRDPSSASGEKQPKTLGRAGLAELTPCVPNAACSSLAVRHAELGGAKPRSHLHGGVRLQVGAELSKKEGLGSAARLWGWKRSNLRFAGTFLV